jgi:ornithine cyclodeaminase/alanine dehydrogenase-like protein (mu-crystallin family)
VILNVSLRDLPAEIILASTNVVDDVDHCLTADTSPHLAEKLSGSRDFVRGTIGEVLNNSLSIDHDIPVIFSPFGLGVLDLAVGDYVLQRAQDMQAAVVISGFNE